VGFGVARRGVRRDVSGTRHDVVASRRRQRRDLVEADKCALRRDRPRRVEQASPGPAMPSTDSCGAAFATAITLRRPSSGVSFSDTTPGRLSLAQSYLRLQ